MPAAFRILIASEEVALAPQLASILEAELEGMGLVGVEAEAVMLQGVTPERVEAAELVLCVGERALQAVGEAGNARAYELLDYLGRTPGTEPALDPAAGMLPVERAEALGALARQLVEQIGRELESDPARPGAASRD